MNIDRRSPHKQKLSVLLSNMQECDEVLEPHGTADLHVHPRSAHQTPGLAGELRGEVPVRQPDR